MRRVGLIAGKVGSEASVALPFVETMVLSL